MLGSDEIPFVSVPVIWKRARYVSISVKAPEMFPDDVLGTETLNQTKNEESNATRNATIPTTIETVLDTIWFTRPTNYR